MRVWISREFGSSASCAMISDTSTWSRKPCNPSTTRSARGCHLCLRYDLLPMCPGRTKSKRRESNWARTFSTKALAVRKSRAIRRKIGTAGAGANEIGSSGRVAGSLRVFSSTIAGTMDLSALYGLALIYERWTDLQYSVIQIRCFSDGCKAETLHTLSLGNNFLSRCYEQHRFHCR